MLTAEGLYLVRGDRCLVRDLSFELASGELLLIEGANGSGKTSLLRALAGLMPLEEGRVSWEGRPVAEDPQNYRSSLVWMAHRVGFKKDLDLLANLRFEASLRPMADVEQAAIIERLGLTSRCRLPFRVLSAGQQRRVALARMLLSDCPLWIMDEPFTNLDVDGRALVREVVSAHLAGGGLCLMASHQAAEITAKTRRIQL
ncbi:MAG: cytochrome c biogenesis heme-transporting ATPase CcmA [Gammaproteobacteria bacterium]|nr:cytochrome c biogenesis heme-transporting ATPase CcmA [Gammaproteobacteria bacterium]